MELWNGAVERSCGERSGGRELWKRAVGMGAAGKRTSSVSSRSGARMFSMRRRACGEGKMAWKSLSCSLRIVATWRAEEEAHRGGRSAEAAPEKGMEGDAARSWRGGDRHLDDLAEEGLVRRHDLALLLEVEVDEILLLEVAEQLHVKLEHEVELVLAARPRRRDHRVAVGVERGEHRREHVVQQRALVERLEE